MLTLHLHHLTFSNFLFQRQVHSQSYLNCKTFSVLVGKFLWMNVNVSQKLWWRRNSSVSHTLFVFCLPVSTILPYFWVLVIMTCDDFIQMSCRESLHSQAFHIFYSNLLSSRSNTRNVFQAVEKVSESKPSERFHFTLTFTTGSVAVKCISIFLVVSFPSLPIGKWCQ